MRRLIALVGSIIFIDAMLFGAIIPLLPGYVDEFGLTKLEAGLLFGAFGGGALVGSLPGGVLAGRLGPRRAVLLGLTALAAASFAFAFAGGPWALGLARFVQGIASTTTWAGALAWVAVSAPRGRRGATLGTVFGLAVLGFVIGPLFGGVADVVGIRGAFVGVGLVALALAAAAAAQPAAPPEAPRPGAVLRAVADAGFVGGLWLNTLPAFFFGVLNVLAPLRLDEGGYGPFGIAVVFFAAGLLETVVNPTVGRLSDVRGRLFPVRLGLTGSIGVAIALAFAERPLVVAALVVAAALTFGGFYTPGMALVSDRAEVVGLTQGLGFGVMNTAWAVGALVGPSLGGGLAEATGDAAPYVLSAGLCAATLAAVSTLAPRRPRAA